MNAHRRMEAEIHEFVTSVVDRGEWLASCQDHFTFESILFFKAQQPSWAQASSNWSFPNHIQSDPPQSVWLLWTSDRPVAETSTCQHTTLWRDRHPYPRRDSNLQSRKRSAAKPLLTPLGHWDQPENIYPRQMNTWLGDFRSRNTL